MPDPNISAVNPVSHEAEANTSSPETVTLMPAQRRAITGFYHVAMTGPWKEILQDQLRQLNESGLLDATDRLRVFVLGTNFSEWDMSLLPAPKASAMLLMEPKQWEYPTLGRLYEHCSHDDPDGYVYYVHSKGVKSADPSSMRALGAKDWRDAMQYFIFYRWQECVEALDAGKVACGINLHGLGSTGCPAHYSGNFFWASCAYVRTHLRHPLMGASEFFMRHFKVHPENTPWLPPERWYAEMWLLDSEEGQRKAHQCFEDGTDHYNSRFDVDALWRAGTQCAKP